MSDDWDIDSYKNDYENEEHWELRKNFMLAHKDKFSEDELVCLAQVFTNIEFLGCRYPEQTMIRVAELAKGVVESFREKRKNSLKRTFVAASDAASAKVKGRPANEGELKEDPSRKRKIEKEETENDTNNCNYSNEKNNSTRFKVEVAGKNEQVDKQLASKSKSKKFKIAQVGDESCARATGGELEDFVLILSDEQEHPVNVIQTSASMNKCEVRWEYEQEIQSCKLFLNETLVGTGTGRSGKIRREEAARVAIAKLRETHYAIRFKPEPENTLVGPSELKITSEVTIGEDNVGRKLMKLMGWQGGGLGSKEQGREQPVAATLNVHRDGLGLKRDSFGIGEFRKHAKAYIHSWAKSQSEGKLVFSANFTEEERKVMHEIAKSYSLKSKSYGKEENRHLVISRKPDPKKILQELLKLGGNSDRYELLMPTKG